MITKLAKGCTALMAFEPQTRADLIQNAAIVDWNSLLCGGIA
jgi:hypothetical protein